MRCFFIVAAESICLSDFHGSAVLEYGIGLNFVHACEVLDTYAVVLRYVVETFVVGRNCMKQCRTLPSRAFALDIDYFTLGECCLRTHFIETSQTLGGNTEQAAQFVVAVTGLGDHV